jgi:hypothetical protein
MTANNCALHSVSYNQINHDGNGYHCVWCERQVDGSGGICKACNPSDYTDRLEREVKSLRESEAKAWGLVEEILMRDAIQVESNRPSDRRALTIAIRDARAALAARKAGK